VDGFAAGCGERVVIQRGSTAYRPRHADHFRYAQPEAMEALTREARAVVAHAAAGAAVLALRAGKPLVLVPRRRAYGEHLDDHQVELARALAAGGRAVVVDGPTAETLGEAICSALRLPVVGNAGPEQLIAALREQLARWEAGR
jgi:UDP-N-acetylglucosamine transferase subunit ALG13